MHPDPGSPTSHALAADRRVDAAWRQDRAFLMSFAQRMLGSRSDAEDVVQEAFGRLARVEVAAVDDLRGWLTVVVRRLCLDRLRSAYGRRVEAGLPPTDEPPPGERVGAAAGAVDPADRVTLDARVSEALGVVLDRLTPAERTAFVLHDVFDFPYDAVAEIVGRSVGACRQLARRARLAVRSDAPRTFAAPGRPPVHDVAERFVAACEGGDIDALMALLDPHVDGEATLLGAGPMVHSHGAGEVATRVLALFGPAARRRLAAVALEAGPGLVGVEGDRVVAVIRLELAEGPHGHDVVRHIQAFVRAPG